MSAAIECIRAEGLKRTFQTLTGPVNALDGVSLSAHAGEILCLMGRTGSGKTTLLSLLGLLDLATEGTLVINGTDTSDMNVGALSRHRRGRIGFLFQDAGLINRMTALDSVMLPLRYLKISRAERRNRAVAALSSLGLEAKLGIRVEYLSGGERQRVGFARALAKRPSILICDEPTASLDGATTQIIADQLVDQSRQGVCVILATHDPQLASIADRTLRIESGRIVDPVNAG